MQVYRRRLSEAQARRCEAARRPRCTCRCGGAFHGQAHKVFKEVLDRRFDEQGQLTEAEVKEAVNEALARMTGIPDIVASPFAVGVKRE